jgi:RNA polymerase-binding transcription factor DksA
MIDGERFRSLLEDERAQTAGLVLRLRADIASAEASRRGERVDEQDPEGAATIFEISKETSLLNLQLDHLEEIHAALDRINDGSYGTCLECGQLIPEARLEARPWTGYCIDHATRHRPPGRIRPVA